MTKKLTTAIATEMVNRIEDLQNQISAIYREAGDYAGGVGNINSIREAVKAREDMRNAECIAQGNLEAFDLEDESA